MFVEPENATKCHAILIRVFSQCHPFGIVVEQATSIPLIPNPMDLICKELLQLLPTPLDRSDLDIQVHPK